MTELRLHTPATGHLDVAYGTRLLDGSYRIHLQADSDGTLHLVNLHVPSRRVTYVGSHRA